MSFHPEQKNIYTTPGSYTWVCPPDVFYINLLMIGAGGGGGQGGGGGAGNIHFDSSHLFVNSCGGGGGSSGAYGQSGQLQIVRSLSVTPGLTYTIGVGAGGTGGTTEGAGGAGGVNSGNGFDGEQGTAGGFSQFSFPNGLSYMADGGLPGFGGKFGSGATITAQGNGGAVAVSGDGSQAGLQGGYCGNTQSSQATLFAITPNSTNLYDGYIGSSSSGTGMLYAIYSEASLSPYSTTNSYNLIGPQNAYGPIAPASINSVGIDYSNMAQDISALYNSPANTITPASTISTVAGGAGGILQMLNYIPLYLIGIDLNAAPSTGIIFPYLFSNAGAGLGSGNTSAAGTSPSTTSVGFYATGGSGVQPTIVGSVNSVSGVTNTYGFGAGGLGGPGGGGGAAIGPYPGTIYNGGNGYRGDNGLPGMVMISWS